MKKTISYVVPFYFDQGNVFALQEALQKATSNEKYSSRYNIEFIYINDGSTDNTLTELLEVREKDLRVEVIDLARNYGHQIAVTAGLDYAKGDAVIIMDSDLQDPPSVSLELIDKWEEGYDVVYAQRRTRKDTFMKRFTASVYYRLLQKLSNIDIPRDTGDFRLIDRKVVNEINKYREHDRFLRGMISFAGYRQAPVLFDRDERFAGETGYTLSRLIKLAKDGIIGFSDKPLKMISQLGFLFAFLSLLAILYAIAYRIFTSNAVEGWTFIVISIFFVGGTQMIMLGVLGSYIGRIYTETKGRPLYGVQNRYENKTSKK